LKTETVGAVAVTLLDAGMRVVEAVAFVIMLEFEGFKVGCETAEPVPVALATPF
jgi:hypothetical protein